MKFKLDQNINANTMDENGWTPLLVAVFFRHRNAIEQLIAAGEGVNEKGRRGVTPLHKASVGDPVDDCFIEVPELLITMGADLNAKDEDGLTPLMYAVLEGHKEVVKLLISNGANLNAKDEDGATALHYAAKYGQNKIAELLIANGAELNIRDYCGQTPLDNVGEYPNIISLLKKSGCKTATQLDSVSSEMDSLLSNHSLLWIAPVFDASGFADEARNYVLGIDDAGISVHLKPIPWDVPITELDDNTRMRLESLTRRSLSPDFICVNQFFPTQVPLAEAAAVNVCRTMFESDRIPTEWVSACNEYDFVWVPSEFHVTTFARSGVEEAKLRILPEAIDAELYRQKASPLWAKDDAGFSFLSTFVWQPRKAWDILLEAYCREFSSGENASLILKVFPDHGLSPEAIEAEAWGFIQDRLGLSRKEAPKIRFVHDSIPVSDMPRLYHSADCFVLPTRGEGWGRPLMEAMACGLPVVAPIFGGQSAFMNSDNAYIVDHTVVPVPAEAGKLYPKYAGHNWAEPSLEHLRELMRRVFSNQAEARETGSRAREHILSHFGRDQVGDWIRGLI